MSDKRKDYISWDEYFMGVAKLSALRSKDPNTQVDRKSTRLNSSHNRESRMPSSA